MHLRIWTVYDCIYNREVIFGSAQEAYDYSCQMLKETKNYDESSKLKFLEEMTQSYKHNPDCFGIEDLMEVELDVY